VCVFVRLDRSVSLSVCLSVGQTVGADDAGCHPVDRFVYILVVSDVFYGSSGARVDRFFPSCKQVAANRSSRHARLGNVRCFHVIH